jgi:uncharacterized protein (TIGR02246 family)
MSRRFTWLTLVFVLMMTCTTGLSASLITRADEADEAAIKAIFKQMEDGWNAHDGKAFSAPFAADADYVVVNGMHLKGREAIEKVHTGIFTTIYKESHNQATVKSIRFIRPDVAVAHVEWQMQPNPKAEKARAMSTFILTKDSGKWSITAFHNTPIALPPHGH